MYEHLDRRYAKALYEVAEEKGKVDEYINDLRDICNLLEGNKDLKKLIEYPQIATKKKKKIMIDLLKGHIDEELLSFILILIEKKRIIFIREKLNQMELIHLEKRNKIKAIVKSVIPLNDEQIKRLKERLENKFKKEIILDCKIDKSIIGGLYVRVGSEVIDGTIKCKLEEMKEIILRSE